MIDSVHCSSGPSVCVWCDVLCITSQCVYVCDIHTYTRLTALFPELPGWAGTRKVKQSGFYRSKRQWMAVARQLGHMQVYTSLQTDNHASTPPLSFLQAGCLFKDACSLYVCDCVLITTDPVQGQWACWQHCSCRHWHRRHCRKPCCWWWRCVGVIDWRNTASA